MPVIGLGETVRAAGKKLLKWHRGALGQKREAHAATLAEHLITHDCALAQAIVAELFSFEEMLWLLQQDDDEVHKLLAEKLKSTRGWSATVALAAVGVAPGALSSSGSPCRTPTSAGSPPRRTRAPAPG